MTTRTARVATLGTHGSLACDEAYRAAKDDAAACRQAAADEYNAKHFKDLRPAQPRTGAGLSQCAGQAYLAPSESDDESSDLEGFSAGAGLPARAGERGTLRALRR